MRRALWRPPSTTQAWPASRWSGPAPSSTTYRGTTTSQADPVFKEHVVTRAQPQETSATCDGVHTEGVQPETTAFNWQWWRSPQHLQPFSGVRCPISPPARWAGNLRCTKGMRRPSGTPSEQGKRPGRARARPLCSCTRLVSSGRFVDRPVGKRVGGQTAVQRAKAVHDETRTQ
jgi:hypothetical protein